MRKSKMILMIPEFDQRDIKELAKLAREGKIHSFCITDELVEKKEGQWKECEGCYVGDYYYECPFCNNSFCTMDGDPIKNGYNYCPECGSHMTGVERMNEEDDNYE